MRGQWFKHHPPPPTKTDRKLGAADRTVVKEVGRRRRNDVLGGWGNIREVSHRRPQERQSGGEGGVVTLFNHGVDPQLRIIENLGSMT